MCHRREFCFTSTCIHARFVSHTDDSVMSNCTLRYTLQFAFADFLKDCQSLRIFWLWKVMLLTICISLHTHPLITREIKYFAWKQLICNRCGQSQSTHVLKAFNGTLSGLQLSKLFVSLICQQLDSVRCYFRPICGKSDEQHAQYTSKDTDCQYIGGFQVTVLANKWVETARSRLQLQRLEGHTFAICSLRPTGRIQVWFHI
jgi:hypothetical protein